MKVNSNTFKKILLLVPIIVMILILLVSSWLFEENRVQTYKRVKSLKETEVQVLVTQIDEVLDFSRKPLNENQRCMLESAVNKINEEKGVYCYLLDKNLGMVSEFSKSQKRKFGELIVNELRNYHEQIISENNFGFINENIPHEDHVDNLEVYWQEVPTGDSEYYIIMAVNLEEVQVNEAIDSCKIMIGILNIILTFSLYGNVFSLHHKDDKDDK